MHMVLFTPVKEQSGKKQTNTSYMMSVSSKEAQLSVLTLKLNTSVVSSESPK